MDRVQVLRRVRKLRKRQAKFAVAGFMALALIGAAGAAQTMHARQFRNQGLSDPLATSTVSQTPEKAASLEPQPKTSETGTDNADQAPPANAPAPSATAVPSAKSCATIEAKQQEAYGQEMKKIKEDLDETLSLRVGLNISGKYVEDFNKAATDIYNKYSSITSAANCHFPVKQPAVLPLTYLPV